MDIDFIVQDSFAMARPQWKLATTFEDAGRVFAEAVKNNYRAQEVEKIPEPEESDESSSGGDDEDIPVPEMEDGQSSADEAEADVYLTHLSVGKVS